MRIAQVSPLIESVPPQGYGGTERVISYLTEELVRLGHEVTLFATADSATQARLIPSVARSLRGRMSSCAWMVYEAIQMDKVVMLAREFDIIHFHTDYQHFPLVRNLGTPHVTTLHGRLDLPELVPLYEHFRACPLVSISDSQRAPVPWANWYATVPHGLPPELHPYYPKAGDYFAFVGRISPEKGIDRAVEIALACETPLYIGAKIDNADKAYFEREIKHLFNHPLIHYVGEVDEQKKNDLLGHAKTLLFPIDWAEPFGLVMIEAFSCGLPVVAYRHGSVPEVMEDGVTGFIVDNQDEAVQAAKNIGSIDRAACRAVFERRFTANCMANHYLQVYERLIMHKAPASLMLSRA